MGQFSVKILAPEGHVWNGPGFKSDIARIWRRHECGHVSGLLTRPHDRQPRWVPRMASKQFYGIDVPLTLTGLPPFVGSTDRHLLLSLSRPWHRLAVRQLPAAAGIPHRVPSSPRRSGRPCWPERPPRLCAAGAPAIAEARHSPICCRAWRSAAPPWRQPPVTGATAHCRPY